MALVAEYHGGGTPPHYATAVAYLVACMAKPCMRLDFRPPPTFNGTMKQGTCKGEHEGHLCVLASRGAFGEIKKLAAKPGYICFNCGRVAECDANLCNPMPIDG
jgi:hypothetical protein